MHDLKDVAAWMTVRGTNRDDLVPATLPDPTFRAGGRTLVSFSTNNYLSLATSPRLEEAARRALRCYGVGNCESRLLGGNLELYDRLEARLAEIKRKESALLFATGYLTNLSVLPTLVKTSNLARAFGFTPSRTWKHAFFTDEFNHLSIREGIRSSGAPSFAYRHLDMNDLEDKLKAATASIRIIVTDGVFSQHGDIVPLPDMMTLADRYDAAVYIDDAHGTGVLGPTGAGTTEHFGIESDRIIHMGTLSKAYGCIGGFVATETYITEILRFGASGFGFTSTLPPDQAAAVLEAIDMVTDEPQRRECLWNNQRYFLDRLAAFGLTPCSDATPIVPVHIGNDDQCVRLSLGLREAGFHVDPIVFPAISPAQSRLRFMMNAHHTREQIDGVTAALAELLGA
ncbi:MAG TPA: aminotransferase class I/II-fold pyridoxal phosphate-dependent enzyme [Gemmatimonadaceae bacterium]|jgi:8-amino-7-oxononanoate synthase|nr:aminotransferase class I/II-fold pyridoxal phosphate-dependent enzyme [Gemmatimonadaceae bacterium]